MITGTNGPMRKPPLVACFIAVEIYFIVNSVAPTLAAAKAISDHDRIVVMISVDGLANFYLDDPAAPLPTIRRLAAEGARATSMKASDPTVTWTNHTTLATGVSPARHGVVGNNWFDRVKGEKVTLIWDPALDKDQLVKVPTIYDVAKASGLKTAAIRWPATRNARAIDWNSPDLGKDQLVRRFTTPIIREEAKQAGLVIEEGDDNSRDEGIDRRNKISEDPIWTQLFNIILHKYRPNLALLHIVNVDHTQHIDGPRSAEAYAAIKTADDEVRQVWEELQRDFPGKATLFVVSDHGFATNKAKILTNDTLQKAGLVEITDGRVTGGAVQALAQGGSALVYVLDEANRDSIMKQVKQAFANVDGISKVLTPDEFSDLGIADPKRDPHGPDMVLLAKLGYYFGDTAAGDKKEHKGSHGHDSHFPDLHAVFVAWGAGIKPQAKLGEIDNRSVAPTIANLLGIEIPNAEGKALTEALAP
jgi:predicted AlkP superfamily pyrophosphatase or phosphodiesterase